MIIGFSYDVKLMINTLFIMSFTHDKHLDLVYHEQNSW